MKLRNTARILISIFITTLGTYLIYLGSKKDGDESVRQMSLKLDSSKTQILLKLDTFNKKVESAKSADLSQTEKQLKIDTLNSEFDAWAKNLSENFPEIQLSIKKQLINNEEKKIAVHRQWNILLQKTFKEIIELVHSINKEFPIPKINIGKDNEKFPNDFFSPPGTTYSLVLQFQQNNIFKISQRSYAEYLIIEFNLYHSLSQEVYNTDGNIQLWFHNANEFTIVGKGVFTDFASDLKNTFPINQLTIILQKMLTYQLSQSNNKK